MKIKGITKPSTRKFKDACRHEEFKKRRHPKKKDYHEFVCTGCGIVLKTIKGDVKVDTKIDQQKSVPKK